MSQEIRYVKLTNVDPTNIYLMDLFGLYHALMNYDYQFLKERMVISPDKMEELTTQAFLSIHTLVLCKVNDITAGFIATSVDDPGTISEFFVSAEFRRRGIGRQLFTELKSMVKGPLKVNSMYGNEGSFAFYQALGFIPVSIGMTEPI